MGVLKSNSPFKDHAELRLHFFCSSILALRVGITLMYTSALEILPRHIKASGVYVHLEQGHEMAAETLADKALTLLRQHGWTPSSLLDLSELLEKLETRHPVPPRLSNRGQRSALK